MLAAVAAPVIVPAEASAQRRVVRRPAPRSVVHVSARPYYYNYYRPYYRPYHYAPLGFYGGYAGWYSWYGGYPFLYAQYPYPRHYPRYYDYSSAARLQVEPRHAEVFIDGYFVGTVDDFDGWLQRLNVAPGEHELTVYLKGYRTFRQNVLFRPGSTLKIEHVMQPLASGDPEEPRPVASGRALRSATRDEHPDDYPPQEPSHRPGDPVPSPRRGTPVPAGSGESQGYGSLALRVQPVDAEVIVNGEPWQSPQAGSITLQLSDGAHRVEVRKDGYRTYTSEVRVRRGDTTSLNVSLTRE
jgi:hypothetical protein